MPLSKYQLESDPDEVDVDLVCSLVKHVHEKNRAKPDGAILVSLFVNAICDFCNARLLERKNIFLFSRKTTTIPML